MAHKHTCVILSPAGTCCIIAHRHVFPLQVVDALEGASNSNLNTDLVYQTLAACVPKKEKRCPLVSIPPPLGEGAEGGAWGRHRKGR